MDKVQYIGPVEALRGQTALMMTRPIGTLVGNPATHIADHVQSVVQWDWPDGQQFTPRGEPVNAPAECFGWHEVDPTHWRKCHEISELAAI